MSRPANPMASVARKSHMPILPADARSTAASPRGSSATGLAALAPGVLIAPEGDNTALTRGEGRSDIDERMPPSPPRKNAVAPPPRRGLLARLVARPIFWLLGCSLLFGLPLVRSVLRQLGAAPVVLATLPPFTLTDQTG